MDIAREIGPFTNRVYQVYRPGPFELPAAWIPKNAQRIGNIKSFEAPLDVCDTDIGLQRDEPIPKSVILEDGSELRDIHRVILCTGYHFCLPFLPSLHNDCLSVEDADERCLVTDGTQVHNLHKDIFYIPDPTLAFIGIPFYSATFTMFEFQAITLAAMYTGRTKFPRTENMRKEYRDKIERKGYGRLFHSVRDREVEYVDELLAWINQDCAANGVPPIQGYTAKWRSERTVAREKIAKWFLSRSTAKASHVIDAI